MENSNSNFIKSTTQSHSLICQHTGVVVATVSCLRIAGHIPFLAQWRDTQALHPVFSMQQGALRALAKNAWNNICNLTPEEAALAREVDKQEKLLQILALAMLHGMSEVEQTTVWLPTLAETTSCWQSLTLLHSWKLMLDSPRFKFPAVRISQFNNGIDLAAYLHDCWAAKRDYASKVREREEEAKLRTAEAALAGIRDELVKKAPRSKKLLWRWFAANIPKRYKKDVDSWMLELYNAETESELTDFTLADIELFESIVLCEIPVGTSVSHAFLDRLRHKRSILQTKFDLYEVITPNSILVEQEAGAISEVEPKLSDYPNKVAFMIAQSKWRLAHSDMNKHRRAAEAAQGKVTVSASYVPDITEFLGSTADTDEEEDISSDFDLPPDDESITGETED